MSHWKCPLKHVFELVTLSYELDLDILPLDLNAEFQVRMFVRSVGRVVTDTQTDTHTCTAR